MPTQRQKVFISHCIEDSNRALWLANKLNATGLEVWIDHINIPPGSAIVDLINNAIESCEIFILIWSKHAKESKWVNIEWTTAITMNKTIIPILLDETQLPGVLRRLLYIEFFEQDHGYKKLCGCLSSVEMEEII